MSIMNFRHFRRLGLAVTVLLPLAAGVAAPVAAGGFSPEQRQEIEQIVREWLLKNPEILNEMVAELEKRQKAQQAAREKAVIGAHADALFRSPHDLVIGNPEGKVAVVEFSDYNCPYCRRSLEDVRKLRETNKDLKIVIKEFPILGPDSMEAAKYALAARKQGMDKYWDLHVAMMKHKGRVNGEVALALAKRVGLDVERLKKDAESDDVQQALQTNMALADALGIRGTPAFVVGEKLIPGALGYERLNKEIERLRKNGCKVC
jgi:protein-disulfide isomerase